MKSLDIGLMGFYGYGAYSDDLIAKAIMKGFDSHADVTWRILPLGQGNYSGLDLVILGGGSLLGHPLPHLVKNLKASDALLIIFGTGFRNSESIDSLRYLWSRAFLIGVRGKTSVERIASHGLDIGKIDFMGDPIFLFENENLQSDGYIRGVVRPHDNVDTAWMREFFEWVSRERGKPYYFLNCSLAQGDWGGIQNLDNTYRQICKSSFWFGNRLHPFCVALINGIPAIAVEIEFQKVADVCSTIDYFWWVKSGDFVKKTYRAVIKDWELIRRHTDSKINLVRRDLQLAVERALKLC